MKNVNLSINGLDIHMNLISTGKLDDEDFYNTL